MHTVASLTSHVLRHMNWSAANTYSAQRTENGLIIHRSAKVRNFKVFNKAKLWLTENVIWLLDLYG